MISRMDNSTENLLIALISILSFLFIICLIMLISLIIYLHKLAKKVYVVVNLSKQSLGLMNIQLAKNLGIFSLGRLMKKRH